MTGEHPQTARPSPITGSARQQLGLRWREAERDSVIADWVAGQTEADDEAIDEPASDTTPEGFPGPS